VAITAVLAATACDDAASTSEIDAEARVCPAGPTVQGIDVSYYQGTIDWRAVRAAGVRFAYVRVSDGLTHIDSEFDRNWAEARAHGVLRGAYQFFRPGRDAAAQADLLLERMGPLGPGDLPPVLDVETADGVSPEALVAGVRTWLARVEAATGRRPIVYTGRNVWRTAAGNADVAAPLWIAQWGVTCPDLPPPWTDWTFWQTSATGSVPGISGDVDTDVFNGDLAALLALAGVDDTCGDGTCGPAEDADACPADCPPCGVVPAEGGVIDDVDECFVAGGPAASLRAVDGEGWDGSLVWTYTTAAAAEANYAEWDLHLAEAGRYRIEVFTPAAYARSRQAHYRVRHAGRLDGLALDQAAVDGWQVLGELELAAGGHQSIHLGDNTGEPRVGEVQLALDAIRLTRVGDAVEPPLPPGPDPVDDVTTDGVGLDGGCDAGRSGGSGGWLGLAVGLLDLARRRRVSSRLPW
jgi:GH25 family lysozyme M1 (1,4-beta-N-acetylmuramidase)